MKQFNIHKVPLQGVTMVQSGAGSGKTYTIIHLYLRALLQLPQAAEAHNILVLTFTRAATAELQTRVRTLLSQTLQQLQQGKKIHITPNSSISPEKTINAAIYSMDEAAIFTIHGFCKHVLEEYSFLCGQPQGAELTGEQDSIGMDITEDYWRRLYSEDQMFVSYVMQHYNSPQELYQELHKYTGRPGLDIVVADSAEEGKELQQQLHEAHQEAASLWQRQRDKITQLLLTSEALNRNKYRKDSLPGWFAQMDNLLSQSPTAAPLFQQFSKFCSSDIQQNCKKGHDPPRHEFFNICEKLREAHTKTTLYHAARFSQWQRDYIEYMDEQRHQRCLRGGTLGYHDLLLRLYEALGDKERGQQLAARLRQRFPVALIDEFQDTDELQYRILSRIYSGDDESCLYYVGDPKQAIYGFRGADVFSYMQATRDADNTYKLDSNYRSHPDLVAAVNTIFTQEETPFALKDINYTALKAQQNNKNNILQKNGKTIPAMTIWDMGEAQKNKATAEQQVAQACAARIAELLHPDNSYTVQKRPIQAADIAVLIETHNQGDIMRQELAQHAVIAVTQRYQSVYSTDMARQLSILLHAITHPDDLALGNTAMVSALLGHDALWLHQHSSSDYSMHQWHDTWQRHGFMPMFWSITRTAGVAERILAEADGEQHLTDLLQLGELLQEASYKLPEPMALLQYLDDAMANSDSDSSDQHRRRLQSDENLVQIVTVHASKGLEYPVTFCPFHWANQRKKEQKPPLFYHEQENNRATLQLDPQQCNDQVQNRYHTEQLSEKLRLFYVSLTRASCHCTMVYAEAAEDKENIFSTLLPQGIPPKLQQLTQKLPEQQDTKILPLPQKKSTVTTARGFTAKIQNPRTIESFSSLSRHDSSELPDYDGRTTDTANIQTEDDYSIHTMPAGITTGICLHSILEHTDFIKGPDPYLIQQQLQLNGFASHWSKPVEQMVQNTINTPMFKEQVKLNTIEAQNRVNEMEFIYPVENISSKQIAKIAKDYMDKETTAALKRANFNNINGYLKGFIDLVFTSNNTTWVVDYKSNRIGNSSEDYSQERMKQAIIRENYTLQYLIYCLALHRLLKSRINNYDYNTHHGGACYLFLRGLGNGDNGIFHYKPPQELIQRLDSYVG